MSTTSGPKIKVENQTDNLQTGGDDDDHEDEDFERDFDGVIDDGDELEGDGQEEALMGHK